MEYHAHGKCMVHTCYHAEVSLCFECIKHLDYVLMSETSQNVDFLAEVLDVLLGLAMLHDELHGCDLACAFTTTFVDLRETRRRKTNMNRPPQIRRTETRKCWPKLSKYLSEGSFTN